FFRRFGAPMIATTAALLVLFAPAVPQDGAADLAAPDALHIAVVLDDSGSMSEPMPGADGTKMDAAKAALRETFAALPPDARVGVFILNGYGAGLEGSSALLPIASHTDAEVAERLKYVYAAGGTPLGTRIAEATAALAAEKAVRKYGDYRLLIVTDGDATDEAEMDVAVPAALGAGLTMDVIGVAMKADHALATRVDRYRRADDPASFREALREVLAESTGDSDAGAESDYEVIAPLPDGAAAVALRALSAPPEFDPDALPAEAEIDPFDQGALPVPPAGDFEGEPDAGSTIFSLFCCCLLPAVGLGAVGFVLFKVIGGGGRRKR
ncbi:MAG: VWA domain-containing protein, partial [Planctomycetota bacterium]